MCTVLLPPGVNPTAVYKCIISSPAHNFVYVPKPVGYFETSDSRMHHHHTFAGLGGGVLCHWILRRSCSRQRPFRRCQPHSPTVHFGLPSIPLLATTYLSTAPVCETSTVGQPATGGHVNEYGMSWQLTKWLYCWCYCYYRFIGAATAARKFDIKAIDCSLSDGYITPTSVTLHVQHKQREIWRRHLSQRWLISEFRTPRHSHTAKNQPQKWSILFVLCGCDTWDWGMWKANCSVEYQSWGQWQTEWLSLVLGRHPIRTDARELCILSTCMAFLRKFWTLNDSDNHLSRRV